MLIVSVIFLFIIQLIYSYKTNPTPWLCLESTNKTSNSLPACLPGYMIDIENVIYESTIDNSCTGITLCQIENKNALLFACSRKRTCNIDINNLNFYINSTCGLTKRFYVKYHCSPVIQEQNDIICEASTPRRLRAGDINLSCEKNYRLHITKASIGISLKQQDESNKIPFKCNKDIQTMCNYNVPNAYHDVCDSQLREGYDSQCKIRYNERPILKDCQHSQASNFSKVEYLCIPGDGITEDLPRIDICSIEIPERISIDRGLLHSPNYPQALGQYLACKKQLFVPRESRFRLFMLEKSIEYSHELNIRLKNNIQTLARNELIDINITNQNHDEFIIQFELKTNHVGGGKFLLYFQIDSPISEYAPFIHDSDKINRGHRHGKLPLRREWGIFIGCVIGLVLVIVIVGILFLMSKRHRERSLRYLKSEDDHRQRLNLSSTSPDHHHDEKHLHLEQPYLTSSSPAILPSSINNHNRPNSASSTTSSIIIHQLNDGLSDRESLLKPADQMQSRSNGINSDIDNFYEEIKEQQQQTALALGRNDLKGDIINPYLEAKSFETNRIIFQGNNPVQPIRDHNESQPHYQTPASSTQTEPDNVAKKSPPKTSVESSAATTNPDESAN